MTSIREYPPAGVGEGTDDGVAAGPRERPILLSGPMVQAVLAGTKTQTRRRVKPQPPNLTGGKSGFSAFTPAGSVSLRGRNGDEIGECFVRAKYGLDGDRLWVKETFAACRHGERHPECIEYRADNRSESGLRWTPSIYMPRWASRITLEITEVRVQRLQEISEADAIAEGVLKTGGCANLQPHHFRPARDLFRELWDSINGAGSWSSNPWVWAISFRRLEPTP
jgi:hypothetical protein